MNGETVRVEVDKRGVATVTLNRPEHGNAYDADMLDELAAAFARLGADAGVRVVLLRAKGRHFCVGADLKAAASSGHGSAGNPRTGLVDVCLALDRLPKPTVAVVRGGCIGGGAAVAACCDIVLAERGAFFSIPEVRLGFAPAPLVPVFVRAIGARVLRRFAQTGERFSVDDALRMGLVHLVSEPGTTEAALAKIIDDLLHGAPAALTELKAVIAQVEGIPVTRGLLAELQDRFAGAHASAEAQEGRAAFREKRKPDWYSDS